MRKLLVAAALLALAACQSAQPISAGQAIADACMSADALLKAAITLDKQGKLSATQVNAVSVAGATINGYCAQSAPPTDVQAALADINGAMSSLATIPGVK